MKIKLTEFTEYHNADFDEALQIAQEKLPPEYISGRARTLGLAQRGKTSCAMVYLLMK